jgi:hypothetical protein
LTGSHVVHEMPFEPQRGNAEAEHDPLLQQLAPVHDRGEQPVHAPPMHAWPVHVWHCAPLMPHVPASTVWHRPPSTGQQPAHVVGLQWQVPLTQ